MVTTPERKITPVTRFRSVREDTRLYPGDITDWSFVYDPNDGNIHPIAFPDGDVLGAMVETESGLVLLHDWLHERGQPGLDERYAVRAYAANRNPRVAAPDNKLGKKPVAPTIIGKSTGLAVVYQNAGGLGDASGLGGYMFGDSYADDSAGFELTEAITLLSLEDGEYKESQLHLMDLSEPNYTRRIDPRTFTLETGQELTNTMIYAGAATMFKSQKYDSPIGIAEIPFTGSIPRLNQEEMLDLVVEELGLSDKGIRSGLEFRQLAGAEWIEERVKNPNTRSNPPNGIVEHVKMLIKDPAHHINIDTADTFKDEAPESPGVDYTLQKLLVA